MASPKEKSPTTSLKNTESALKSSQTFNQIKAISNKRILREIEYFQLCPVICFSNLQYDPKDIKKWFIQLEPRYNPYKHGIFKIKIDFHQEYPFKPPRIQFLTPIYHFNVDEKGILCLSITQMDNWKSATTINEILKSILDLIENPEPERSLRIDLAEQFIQNKVLFYKVAAIKAKKETEKWQQQQQQTATITNS